jgi:hypothetical protein
MKIWVGGGVAVGGQKGVFFVELMHRAWDSAVASMGTTTLAVASAAGVAFIYVLYDLFQQWRLNGVAAMQEHWRERISRSVLAGLLWWTALFMYNLVWKVPHEIRVEAGSVTAPPLQIPTPPAFALNKTPVVPVVPAKIRTSRTFRESSDYFISYGSMNHRFTTDKVERLIGMDKEDVLSARVEKGKILVTAKLFAGLRSQPVEIVDNTIMLRRGTWDRNYDDTAFEVVDENLKPVLQIIYTTPHNVAVYGIFGFGASGQIAAWLSPGGAIFKPTELPTDPRFQLKRIFKYPSRTHQGQEADN